MLTLDTTNKFDLDIIARHDKSIRVRACIELAIVRLVLTRFRERGYALRADNGEEDLISSDDDQMIECLFACDEAKIHTKDDEGKYSFVLFVFGNDGWDVISDYGMSLDYILAPITDRMEENEQAFVNEEKQPCGHPVSYIRSFGTTHHCALCQTCGQ